MRIQSDGKNNPSRFQEKWVAFKEKLRAKLVDTIELHDEEYTYLYRAESLFELYRPMTLLIKEEGTMKWIKQEVKPGDVFYDIGANIGIYTLAAGKRLRGNGRVYAFEPHTGTFQSLLKNISLNQLDENVKAISTALNSEAGFFDFHYCEWTHGSTASQLGTKINEYGKEFRPVASEYKYAMTLDQLLASNAIQPATLIKLDVDGNELKILQGMEKFLKSPQHPRSIQVEMNLNVRDEIYSFLKQMGYEENHRHFTYSGKLKISQGVDPKTIPYNAVFTPGT